MASGQVLGVVDGRDSAAVEAWLGHRSQAWRDQIQIVAMDPSAAFKKAVITVLPAARIAVDPFHLVQLANLCLTRVRQRLVQEHQQRRGRKIDPAWTHRTLLLRGYDTLSARARDRLEQVFATDDPTGELSAAWGVKEGLRLVLKTTTLDTARQAKTRLGRLGERRRHPPNRPALGHPEHLVAGHRGIHHQPGHQRPHRSREHRHQAHQADRTWLPQQHPLPSPYPSPQRPPGAATPLTSQGTTGNCE